MRKIFSSKKLAAVAVAAVAVTGTGVAYAYWTTTGSGTGSATAGADDETDAIQLTQADDITGLYPGGPAANINVTATNPAAFAQEVGEVSVTVVYPEDCDDSNWALTEGTDEFALLAANDSAVGGSDEATATVGTFRLKETGLNQDLCKNAQPDFTFSSLAGATDDRS